MAAQSVDVSDFVPVQVNISPLAIPYANFGLPIILGNSGVVDTREQFRTYTTITQVGADFGNTSPEYLAAQIFFSQVPQPNQVLIGAWARTATSGKLKGATLTATQQLIGNFTPITTGAFQVFFDGVPYAITGINLTATLNLNGVAAAIQTAIQAASAGTTCVWNAVYSRFEIKSGTTGVNSSVSYLAPPTAQGYYLFAGQPAAADVVTVNGTPVTFVSGTPSGNQVQIAGTQILTMTALTTFLNSSVDVNISKMIYLSDGVSKIYCISKATGTTGNAYTLAKTSTNITVSAGTLAGGVALASDLSTLTGGTATSGASPLVQGVAAQTPLTAVQNSAGVSNAWYGVSFAASVQPADADYEAVAAYILASTRSRLLAITIQNVACLDPTQTTDLASVLQSFNNKRVCWVYSSANPYAIMSLIGRAFTVNWNGQNTALTLAYKQMPGVPAEALNETQFATIIAKGGNVNILVDNGAQMIWPGQMSNGFWFDEVHGVDWLQNRIETDLFNLEYTSPTKIPQTDDGGQQLKTTIESSCQAGIYNGLGAPGVWQSSLQFGSLFLNDTLDLGYYVWVPLIATQSQALRVTRVSVVIQVAFKLAGAVHQPQVILNINR